MLQQAALRRLGAVVLAGATVAGCVDAAPSAFESSAASSPDVPPATTEALRVCPPASETARGASAEPHAWPGLNAPTGLSSAIEVEATELVAAIGNPDTNSPSVAWGAFEDAIRAGDPATIRSSADAVVDHLRAACAPVAPFFDQPGAASWAADVRGLLDGLAGAVATLRDAAIQHDEQGLDADRDQMQTVLLDHFYQSFKLSDPEGWRVQLPDQGWSATASHVRWLVGGVGAAFDGTGKTMWLAGDATPPQWIEVDFGAERMVSGIRLLVYQGVDGVTDHLVSVRTATGRETELVRFTGDTRDEQWLEYTAPAAIEQIRYVRITTLASPSMIGWREVEVILAPGSGTGPCSPSTTTISGIAKAAASPSSGVRRWLRR